MNSLRFARTALRARPASLHNPLLRRSYAEAVPDKIKLSLALPHQVRWTLLTTFDEPWDMRLRESPGMPHAGYEAGLTPTCQYANDRGSTVHIQINRRVCSSTIRDKLTFKSMCCYG